MEPGVGDKELKKLRKRVDRIDSAIVELLEKRWKATKAIGAVKKKQGVRYYDPAREREVIKKVTEKTALEKRFVKKMFIAIMEHCRNGESQ
jgi:chorismate mutase